MFTEMSVDQKSRGRKATEQATSEEVQELGRLGGGAKSLTVSFIFQSQAGNQLHLSISLTVGRLLRLVSFPTWPL